MCKKTVLVIYAQICTKSAYNIACRLNVCFVIFISREFV